MKTPTALDLPAVDPLPESTEKYFRICHEKLGMVPNVLQAHAFDIAKLNAFTSFYNELMLADSGLSKLEREMIAVVVSSINRCFYCLTAHGAAVRELSGNPILGEQLVMNYRTAELEPRQRAMLDQADRLAAQERQLAARLAAVVAQHGGRRARTWRRRRRGSCGGGARRPRRG